MSVSIDIYSRVYDKVNDMYADYTDLIQELPKVSYYPPPEDNINFYFQGTVIVEDLEFVRALINRVEFPVMIDATNKNSTSDLILIIMDGNSYMPV